MAEGDSLKENGKAKMFSESPRLRWEGSHDGNVDVKTMKTGAKVSIPAHSRLVEALGGLPVAGQARNGSGQTVNESGRSVGQGRRGL